MNINQKIEAKGILSNVKTELKNIWGWSDKQYLKYVYTSYDFLFFSSGIYNVKKLSKRARRNLI